MAAGLNRISASTSYLSRFSVPVRLRGAAVTFDAVIWLHATRPQHSPQVNQATVPSVIATGLPLLGLGYARGLLLELKSPCELPILFESHFPRAL